MAITGNKGEWSEIYTFFKILSDKNLFPGDQNLEKIQNLIYPIICVLRTESSGSFAYTLKQDIVVVSSEDKELARINVIDFQKQASDILKAIKSEKGTFAMPEVETFMSGISCESLKAKSSSKTDIKIMIHDQRTGQQPILGFSIKSQLGKASTLLNAGKSTNFKYKIIGTLSDEVIKEINDSEVINKLTIRQRIAKIYEHSCKLKFEKIASQNFSSNMVLIDSLLPQILSEMLLNFYSSSVSKTTEILKIIEASNPLKFDLSSNHPFYVYKLKRFYTDAALGMTPAKVWDGNYDATGGYLIVKDDGDILCYHLYNKYEFENYLIENTKFETASTTRYDFGSVYKENDTLYMNLNLQVRFIK